MHTPSKWYYVIAILALLWNLLGCLAFAMNVTMTEEDISALSRAEEMLYRTTPQWAIAGSALAVLSGTLGCIAMLLKHRWAVAAFALSLVGLLVQDFHMFVLSDAVEVYGMTVPIMQGLVLIIAIALLMWSRRASARGVIR